MISVKAQTEGPVPDFLRRTFAGETTRTTAVDPHGRRNRPPHRSQPQKVLDLLRSMAGSLLRPKETAFIDDRLHLVEVHDGETLDLIGHETTFFDIGSTKATQYGFAMDLGDGRRLVCCGDEPLTERGRVYAEGADWMLHEAFCLYSEADIFDTYEKHHSTVKDACELAEELGVKNLLLYHTEDKNLERRKELYGEEGRPYFSGNLWVSDDLEVVEL